MARQVLLAVVEEGGTVSSSSALGPEFENKERKIQVRLNLGLSCKIVSTLLEAIWKLEGRVLKLVAFNTDSILSHSRDLGQLI